MLPVPTCDIFLLPVPASPLLLFVMLSYTQEHFGLVFPYTLMYTAITYHSLHRQPQATGVISLLSLHVFCCQILAHVSPTDLHTSAAFVSSELKSGIFSLWAPVLLCGPTAAQPVDRSIFSDSLKTPSDVQEALRMVRNQYGY